MRKLSYICLALFLCLAGLAGRAVFGDGGGGKACGVVFFLPVPCGGNRDCPLWARAGCVSDPVYSCVEYSYYPQQFITLTCVQYPSQLECLLSINGVPVDLLFTDQFCTDQS